MAKEQVVKLFRAVQTDPVLKEKLNSAPDLETLVQLAGEQGYNFTVEEWEDTTKGCKVEEFESELSEIPGL